MGHRGRYYQHVAKTILFPYPLALEFPISQPPLPPPQFPGTYRHDLNVFTALWDEHMNTDVRPPPLTCVTDSSYEYLGLRLIDNPCHYSTEWSETLNPWINGNSSTPEL